MVFLKKALLFIAISFSLLSPILSHGQEKVVTVEGKVTDVTTGSPLPLVTVHIVNTPLGTITNESGNFALNVSSANASPIQLSFSSVGYAGKSLTLSLSSSKPLEIKLIPSSFILDEVVIYSETEKKLKPEKMVKKALRRLKKTCPPYNSMATLNHYITENGKYRRYQEMKLLIRDPDGYGKSLKGKNPIFENTQVLQKRESLDLSVDGIKFDNHLNNPLDFMQLNGLQYDFIGKGYSFQIMDSVQTDKGQSYVILAMHKKDTLDKKYDFISKYDMKFYLSEDPINRRTFNLTKFELTKQFKIERKEYTFHENAVLVASLERKGANWKPKKITYLKLQHTRWHNDKKNQRKLVSYNELNFDEVNVYDDFNAESLAKNYEYIPSYWSESPIDKKIINDLSEEVLIEDQFNSQNDMGKTRHLLDSIHYLRLRSKLDKFEGHKNVYFIIWNNKSTFYRYFEVQPLLDWLTIGEDTEVFFISTMNHIGRWSGTSGSDLDFALFDHSYIPFSWKKIVLAECTGELPLHIIINKSGKATCASLPFNARFLKSFY